MGLRLYTVLLGVACCFTLFSSQSFAAGPFRCNGRIQFRPCGMPFPGARELTASPEPIAPTVVSNKPSANPLDNDPKLYATVLEQSFSERKTKRSREVRQGEWRGIVDGNGEVHLELQILRNGTEESRLYMGSVLLVNQPTTFHFVSALPTGNNWTWNVAARAERPKL